MRYLPLLTVLFLGPAPVQEPPNPLAARERFELEVQHWEGTFGTYLFPQPGDTLRLDLGRIGQHELTTVEPVEGPTGHFALEFLEKRSDTVTGDATSGWHRRVVLAGRGPTGERTLLELEIQHDVERWTEEHGHRRKLNSNHTGVVLRLHTLRDDDTLREYGLAWITEDRDRGELLRSR